MAAQSPQYYPGIDLERWRCCLVSGKTRGKIPKGG
jgi:hypothetical protein